MRQTRSSLLVLILFLPSIALAHTGVGEARGLMHGFGHPLAGADHVLAMFAVGLWAAQVGGRVLWAVPCTFVVVMIFGGILGFTGVAIPFVEGGILLCVLITGVLLAGAVRLPLVYSTLIVGIFAIFHGHAHGAEMPASIGAASYTVGFALATALLHFAGMGLGLLLQEGKARAVARIAGGAIALGGLYLAISPIA